MSNRVGVIILSLVCLGLAVGLVVMKKQAFERFHEDAVSIESLSNKWVEAKNNYEDQIMEVAKFRKDLTQKQQSLSELSNNLSQTAANLDQANTALAKDEAALKASAEELKKREDKIAELESQNRSLDQRAVELQSAITNLATEIVDVRRQLTAAKGDKAILEQRLRQLMSEKADLERQFSDLDIVRAQLTKLKDNLVMMRRRDWIHRGLMKDEDMRGAQRQMQGVSASAHPSTAPKPAYDLNVEVGSDGSVRIVQPTNAPAATNPPVKK